MNLGTRNVHFELKQVGDAGQFEGFAAIYNIRDDLGDVIEPGAFTRTLQHRKGKYPVLWQHAVNEVIGFATVQDGDMGLMVNGSLNMEVARAREVHALMRQALLEGVPFGLSFGFETLKAERRGGVRYVKEIKLIEISPTLFPAQQFATISAVKSVEGKPFGPYDDFADCVAKNQEKENPEGFCAWLHHELTGEWPTETVGKTRAQWEQRVQAVFEATPEIKLSREQVATLCPACAEKMAQQGIVALTLKRDGIKQMPPQLLEGLCAKFGGDEGFFTRCVDGISGIDDPEAFCAWLHHECVGTWPGERSLVGKANEYVRAAAERLAALLTGLGQKAASDSEVASLWSLMHEIRTEARRRLH